MKKNLTILIAAVVFLFVNSQVMGQCPFDVDDIDKTEAEVLACLLSCGCTDIEVSAAITVNEEWDLSGSGSITINVLNNGQLTFTGSGINSGVIIFGSGSEILIEDTEITIVPALVAATAFGNTRLNFDNVPTGQFNGNDFPAVIAAGGANEFGVLPVELISFTVKQNNDQALLEWSTASELNNDFFIVERSPDGIDFEYLGTKSGRGTTNKTQYYSLIDPDPFPGRSYYRLIQTDYDGATEKFDPIAFNNISASTDYIVYPSPLHSDQLNVFSNAFQINSKINVAIYNQNGQLVMNAEPMINSTGSFEQALSVVNLPRGIYYMHILNGRNRITKKLIKM